MEGETKAGGDGSMSYVVVTKREPKKLEGADHLIRFDAVITNCLSEEAISLDVGS